MTPTPSSAQAAAITGARNWDAVAIEHPRRVDAMARGLGVGDPAADAVVEEIMSGRTVSWRQVIDSFEHPEQLDDLPSTVADFIAATAATPSWFDPALARAGAHAWWRFGSLQSSTLYQSLIYGYQARGFVRPLIETGRLTDGTWDRVLSTARWVTLATAPEMMDPGRAGWVETSRIRLVHAMVRHHLRANGWDDEAWGAPINQTYSQLTLVAGFLVLPMRVAKDFGIRYSAAELEAICHLWRWIGSVMGVPEHMLPESFAEAEEIYEVAAKFDLEPVPESRELVRALLDDGYRTDLGLPGPLNDVLHTVSRPFLRVVFGAVSTRWVDKDVAVGMGLRPTPLHHLVDLARPVVRSREIARAMGLLGSEATIARRELRLVAGRLGIRLDEEKTSGRYQQADRGRLTTVA